MPDPPPEAEGPADDTAHQTALAVRIACTVAFAWVLLGTAWICDDAYITFRSVEQVMDGNGPRWNPHERVQAFSHPLWFLALMPARIVLGDPATAALALSVPLALAAFWLLTRPIRHRPLASVLVLALVLGSRAFVDFSTSGLEDPLSHLLLILFGLALLRDEPLAGLRTAAWPAGLLLVCRHDNLWLVAPALAWLTWTARSAGWRRLLRSTLPAWAPLAAWTAFSVVYYGFPFPNTAYAKLNTGIPAHELWRHGVDYVTNALVWDPLTLVVAVVGAWLWSRRGSVGVAVTLGLLLHLLYVVRIGGDFMAGRFFTEPFALALVALAAGWATAPTRPRLVLATASVAAFLLLWPLTPLRIGDAYRSYHPDDADGIADERAFYTGRGSFSGFKRRWPVPLWQAQSDPQEHFEVGWSAYSVGTDRVVVDRFALADPLLARLPAEEEWKRVGHFRRAVPAGYPESLREGRNRIRNPFVHRLYDDVRKVTQGPLWSVERWAAIWRLNVSYRRPGCVDPPCRKLVTQALPPQLFRPLLPTVDPADGAVDSVATRGATVVVEGRVPFSLAAHDQLVRIIAPLHPESHGLTLTPGQDPASDLQGFQAFLHFENASIAGDLAPVTCVAVAAEGGPWRLLGPTPTTSICSRLGDEP